MKKLIIIFSILCITACKQEKSMPAPAGAFNTPPDTTSEAQPTADDIAFEEALDEVAVPVHGGSIKTTPGGAMVYSIEDLERMSSHIKVQMAEMKTPSAKESMRLNLALFEGKFCCANHDGKHSALAKDLPQLKEKYGCDSFVTCD